MYNNQDNKKANFYKKAYFNYLKNISDLNHNLFKKIKIKLTI